MLVGRSKKYRVISVSLDVLLEILRTLECLATEVALVWFEGNVNSNVGGDMIALHGCGTALIPATGEVQVVCALASNMLLADVLKERFCRSASLTALVPLTRQIIVSSYNWTRSLNRSCSSRFLVLLWCRHSILRFWYGIWQVGWWPIND